MKILITGGAGFIGSHTTELLVTSGHQVTVLDDLSSGSLANLESVLDWTNVVEGDVRDDSSLNRLAAAERFDAILHLAAICSVTEAVRFPQLSHDVNLGGTLNVLEVAAKHDIRRVVVASSAAVYGNPDKVPCSESGPVMPLSQYGVHKVASEHYAGAYAHMYDLETVCLRYFNVFGARQNASSPYSSVISLFINTLLQGKLPTIDGDGLQTRDFVYVWDVARANVAALFKESLEHRVLNVGTGQEVSMIDVYRLVCKLLGKEPILKFAPPRPGDIRRSCADVRLLRKHLDGRRACTLEEGLVLSINDLMGETAEGRRGRTPETLPMAEAMTG